MRLKISDEIVDDIVHKLVNTAHSAAVLRGERYFQEEMRKPIKALCMQDAEAAGHKTAAAQEREAYASHRYQEHLDKIRACVIADETARMERYGWEKTIELWRTQQANERKSF